MYVLCKEISIHAELDADETATIILPTCSRKNLPRKCERNQPPGHFQDLLEAYGNLPTGTEMDVEKENEKYYYRVRSLVAQSILFTDFDIIRGTRHRGNEDGSDALLTRSAISNLCTMSSTQLVAEVGKPYTMRRFKLHRLSGASKCSSPSSLFRCSRRSGRSGSPHWSSPCVLEWKSPNSLAEKLAYRHRSRI